MRCSVSILRCFERRLERETGIEPATNSLEGCDSTTELLPLTGLPPLCDGRRSSPPEPTGVMSACLDPATVRLGPAGYVGQPFASNTVREVGSPTEAHTAARLRPAGYGGIWLASRSSRARSRSAFAARHHAAATADSLRVSRERRLVARGGFEPPKALGRQIYSLLHLTALQPRQTACQFRLGGPSPRGGPPLAADTASRRQVDGAGEGI